MVSKVNVPFGSPLETDLLLQGHFHTDRTDGEYELEALLDDAIKFGINILIPTDHDMTNGAADILTLAEKRGDIHITNRKEDHFEVIIGQEVTTSDGHLLIWGGEMSVLCGMSARETAQVAHDMNALVVVPHPEFQQGEGISWALVNELVELGLIDAVELRNGAQETLTYTKSILSGFPKGKIFANMVSPNGDSNLLALRNYRESGGDKWAAVGGQDGHLSKGSSLLKVLTFIPEGMNYQDAIRQRKSRYSTQNQPEFWGVRMRWKQLKLSRALEKNRQSNQNGIMCRTICEQ